MVRPSRASIWPAVGFALLGTLALFLLVGFQSNWWTPGWRLSIFRPSLYAAQGSHGAMVILAAVWIAAGRGKMTTRGAVALAWVLLLAIPWCLSVHPRWMFRQSLEAVVFGFSAWGGALVLLAAAHRFGIRVAHVTENRLADERGAWQFSIFGLFVVMTEVAIAIGLWRLLGWRERDFQAVTHDDYFWMIVRAVLSLLVLSTVITCYHVQRAWWVNLLLASGFVGAIILLHSAAVAQDFQYRYFPPRAALTVWTIHYGVLFGWLMAALSLTHALGYRIYRRQPVAARERLAAPA